MRKVSDKKRAQIAEETKLKATIYSMGNGLCEFCGRAKISDRGHEIIFRSQGGDPTNPFNVIQLCQHCHDVEHNKDRNNPPHSKEYLLGFIRHKRLQQGFREELE